MGSGQTHLVDSAMARQILGLLILLLLGTLVFVKRIATGSILDKPEGNFVIKLVNIFNLFFLLMVNPVAALLLVTRHLDTIDPTHIDIEVFWFSMALDTAGLLLYVMGFLLMAWALIRLGSNYQLGGITPRVTDKIVVDGPYRLVRHPMYTAALSISLGTVTREGECHCFSMKKRRSSARLTLGKRNIKHIGENQCHES